MKETVKMAKAVSDTNRLRALAALRNGELCACQIIELLELAPSTVSKHMSVLHEAGLVRGEKRGKWVFYNLVDEKEDPGRRALLEWVFNRIENSRQVLEDINKISIITCET